jgi:hypothetical protein
VLADEIVDVLKIWRCIGLGESGKQAGQ